MEKTPSEDNNLLWIATLYLIPISLWVLYTYYQASLVVSFPIALVGVIILGIGACLLFALIAKEPVTQEVAVPAAPTPAPLPVVEYQTDPQLLEEVHELKNVLKEANTQVAFLTEELQVCQEAKDQLKDALVKQQEDVATKELLTLKNFEEMQQGLHEKQEHILLLETQIQDLRYEIKTLLQLTEVKYSVFENGSTRTKLSKKEEPPLSRKVTTESEAKKMLTRCVQLVEKIITGMKSEQLQFLNEEPSPLDIRHLADTLRQETQALVILYSPKAGRLYFAGSESKSLLGVTSDKLVRDFTDLLHTPLAHWQQASCDLLTKDEVTTSLVFKGKNGVDLIPCKACLAKVTSGHFRGLQLAVIYG